jgi:hypothetical protein
MKLEVFERIIKSLQSQTEKSVGLYRLGVDLFEYEEGYVEALTLMLRAYYGEEGEDWISWFVYERLGLDGKVNKAWDKNKKEICYDIPSLWKHVEELRVADDFKEYELPKNNGDDIANALFMAMFGRPLRGK